MFHIDSASSSHHILFGFTSQSLQFTSQSLLKGCYEALAILAQVPIPWDWCLNPKRLLRCLGSRALSRGGAWGSSVFGSSSASRFVTFLISFRFFVVMATTTGWRIRSAASIAKRRLRLNHAGVPYYIAASPTAETPQIASCDSPKEQKIHGRTSKTTRMTCQMTRSCIRNMC